MDTEVKPLQNNHAAGRAPHEITKGGVKQNLPLFSWFLYDFANSAFATIILTVAYGVFFKNTLCEGGKNGDFFWGLTLALSYLAAAVSAPFIGAYADQKKKHKTFFIAASLLCMMATAALSLLTKGMLLQGMLLFMLSFYGFALGMVFYNGFLLELSRKENMGSISGWGWGIGYLGGLVCLLLFSPWLSKNDLAPTFWMTGLFFLIFSIPSFIYMPSDGTSSGVIPAVGSPFTRLKQTLREITKYRELLKFLGAYFFFNDGLSTVITFSSIYAHDTFKMDMKEITFLFLALQVTSFIGSFVSGHMVDRMGAKRTILWGLVLWIITTLGAYFALNKPAFWAVCLAAGLGLGSVQSASRTFVALMTPKEKVGEFFGFFAVFTKFSSFLGPFVFGWVSSLFNSQRAAILSVLFFFAAGFIVLTKVRAPQPALETR
jgi:UMF1 family MFS transporter